MLERYRHIERGRERAWRERFTEKREKGRKKEGGRERITENLHEREKVKYRLIERDTDI